MAEAARQAEVPESTLRYDLDKLDKALPEVLVNQPPGPKSSHPAEALEKSDKPEKPLTCPGCGGQAKKNGTYWVLNWVLMLTMGWQGLQTVLIQRWRCKGCGRELISPERARQAEARQAWWQQVNRLIALSRFKLRLSVRLTQILVKFVYARKVSVGHIERLSQRTIGPRVHVGRCVVPQPFAGQVPRVERLVRRGDLSACQVQDSTGNGHAQFALSERQEHFCR